MIRAMLTVMVLSLSAAYALAHGPTAGRNGGIQKDAGHLHVELLAKGATVQVFLRDQADQAVSSHGHKGAAIFVVDGKPVRIPLLPGGDNSMTGTSAVPLPNTPKGAVQITLPSGSTVQAKFE